MRQGALYYLIDIECFFKDTQPPKDIEKCINSHALLPQMLTHPRRASASAACGLPSNLHCLSASTTLHTHTQST